jgi:hypothetical protein
MRRSARVAAAVDRETSALSPLPIQLVHRIFLLLSVDERARASCVCRGWRTVLADPAAALWTQLDLLALFERKLELYKREPERAGALLRGAARRSHGQRQRLVVSWPLDAATPVLLEVLAANAGSLRELKLPCIFALNCVRQLDTEVEDLLAAAPLLDIIETDATVDWQDAHRLLRGEAQLSRLQLRKLLVYFTMYTDEGELAEPLGGLERVRPVTDALADATLQPTLSDLLIGSADLQQPGVMDSLADAILARRLRSLEFHVCTSPAAAPLARLLAGGVLTSLNLSGTPGFGAPPLFDPAGATLVADALRTNTTLTSLVVSDAGLFSDTEAAQTLLGALVGHRSLSTLELTYDENMGEPVALGAALAAIVGADAPALQSLDVRGCVLGDNGLRPLVYALPQNHHLRTLKLHGNYMSGTFARDHVLPAIRANTSLRKLECLDWRDDVATGERVRRTWPAILEEAQELLKLR